MSRVPDLVAALLDGWYEKIDYVARVVIHEADCPGKFCECPEQPERRSERRKQVPLVTQLVEAGYRVPVTGSGASGPNKPQSKPPGNLIRPDELLSELRTLAGIYVEEWRVPVQPGQPRFYMQLRALAAHSERYEQEHLHDLLERELWHVVRKSRLFLGYESEKKVLADTECGNCGGILIVAHDASSDVHCAGDGANAPCGTVYRRWDWVNMLLERAADEGPLSP